MRSRSTEAFLKLFVADIKAALSDNDETARVTALYAWGMLQEDGGLPGRRR